MDFELLILVVMVAVFVGAFFLLRLPVAIGLMVRRWQAGWWPGGAPAAQLVEACSRFSISF